MQSFGGLLFVCAAFLSMACGSGNSAEQGETQPQSLPTVLEIRPALEVLPTLALAPTATPPPAPTATPPPPTAPPRVVRRDIRATRLTIPALNIDEPVQRSQTIPYRYTPPPGCPPRPQDTSTVTVPNQGIATPVENLEGLENKSWIYGHSRWQGVPGVLFGLQDIVPGQEIVLDGVDRGTGEELLRRRYVVQGLYLTDVDSGDTLINAYGPAAIPANPIVILQTSVREDGPGKQWILDRAKLMAKAQNLVAGDLNDPCKYLLLFVFAG
jgi:hypothetical protein